MGYFIMGMQLLTSLSILVTLHELGHLLPAKWFGMRVEKFYLFFNPKFELFKRQIGETEYGVGWLPLGGYVKIAGMMDESMDKEALAQPPKEWEFRSKPAWQRLIVMVGGVTVNFLLGIFLFAMLAWQYGDAYLSNENLTYGISVSDLAYEMGFRDGDRVVGIGDEKLEEFSSGRVGAKMLLDKVYDVTVIRNNERYTFTVADSSVLKIPRNSKAGRSLYTPRMPFVIGKVAEGTPAQEAGLQIGDSILAIDGTPTAFFQDFKRVIRPYRDSSLALTFYRDGAVKTVTVGTFEGATIGVVPYEPKRFFKEERHYYGFLESFPVAMNKSVAFISSQVKAFGQMFAGRLKATENLGGFVSMGKMFPPYWNWEHFWRMTAALSLVLGFMNLLPIPALDGGHVMFLIYEIVARRPVSDKVMEIAQVVGIILVLGLVLFANGNDLYNEFFGN